MARMSHSTSSSMISQDGFAQVIYTIHVNITGWLKMVQDIRLISEGLLESVQN